ncbi:hypothetical protein B0H11DRAFT_2035509 [Mycena galericulata]|nr:hypothetical protein B0H11DRAFT_2035509 [Mycena galericulata]
MSFRFPLLAIFSSVSLSSFLYVLHLISLHPSIMPLIPPSLLPIDIAASHPRSLSLSFLPPRLASPLRSHRAYAFVRGAETRVPRPQSVSRYDSPLFGSACC